MVSNFERLKGRGGVLGTRFGHSTSRSWGERPILYQLEDVGVFPGYIGAHSLPSRGCELPVHVYSGLRGQKIKLGLSSADVCKTLDRSLDGRRLD